MLSAKKIKLKKNLGLIFLIEGYSGSGKSSFARSIKKPIEKKFGKTLILSGDNFRNVLNINKYSKKDRINNSHIFSKIIQLLSSKNLNVIFSIVGLNNKVRKIYKKNIQNLITIYIESDLQKIIQLKKKDTYKNKKNVVGVNIKPEIPKNPDFKVINNFENNINFFAKKFIKKLSHIKF